jgi:hypothetical protein
MGADAGTFQEIMSKGLGASAGAPAFVEEILQAVAKAGPSSKELKIPQSELYGAIALFAGVAGSASEGGTLATDLMTAIEKFGIEGGYLKRGKTLQQHVADIAKYEAGGMSVYDVLGGRKEAVAAYRMLRNEPEQWQRWMQSVDTASKVNAYANMVGLSSQIPELQVPIAQKSAAAAEELSGERTALIASLEQAILSDVTAGMRERGFGMVAQRIMSLGNQISRTGYRAYDAFFGFSDTSFIEAHREAASDKTRQAIDNFLQASEAQLRAAQAMERMAPVHGVAE